MRRRPGFFPINEQRSTWASPHSPSQWSHNGDRCASHCWVLGVQRGKREKLKGEERCGGQKSVRRGTVEGEGCMLLDLNILNMRKNRSKIEQAKLSNLKWGRQVKREWRIDKWHQAIDPSHCFYLVDCTRAGIYGYPVADMTQSTLDCAFRLWIGLWNLWVWPFHPAMSDSKY